MNPITVRIAELLQFSSVAQVTDSVIDDITDVYDDDDALEDFDPEYLDRLMLVTNAIRRGEFTIADVQSM